MEYYRYEYVQGAVLTFWTAQDVLNAVDRGLDRFELVVDLGLRRVTAEHRGRRVLLEGCELDVDAFAEFREGFAYKIVNCSVVRLDLYADGRYYKLRPIAFDKAPTLEINGIHMHRIYGTDPWNDSLSKVRAVGRRVRGARVLDVCTGLGYTAIAEVALGAESVTTVEVDRNVLYLASMNPWSRGLEDRRIEIVVGDAVEVLDDLEPEGFDVVVHDPPRFEVAGELYSLEFYRKVYGVLRRGGVLVHYTGRPGKHSNVDILKGVKNRLERAGFARVRWVEPALGFVAYKE